MKVVIFRQRSQDGTYQLYESLHIYIGKSIIPKIREKIVRILDFI